jgi:hypothetical protein
MNEEAASFIDGTVRIVEHIYPRTMTRDRIEMIVDPPRLFMTRQKAHELAWMLLKIAKYDPTPVEEYEDDQSQESESAQ